MHRNFIVALIGLLILALASSYTAQATPVGMTDENALKMLRTYMERYEPEAIDGYVVDEMRSAKRGLGPRPLRFG